MRLNKYLAEAGCGSRRACDELIKQGFVRINGNVAQIGDEVRDKDSVTLRGRAVYLPNRYTYIMLHKPKGYITSAKDEEGRKTIMELINVKVRVFPVGRLDYETEGLILLTNDGELANKLTHPAHEVGKTYIAKIEGKTPSKRQANIIHAPNAKTARYIGARASGCINSEVINGARLIMILTPSGVHEGKYAMLNSGGGYFRGWLRSQLAD